MDNEICISTLKENKREVTCTNLDPEVDLILEEHLARNEYPAAILDAARASDHVSFCAKYATRDVWDKYKDKVSGGPGKWTLARAINTGVLYSSSVYGCHAGDSESYEDFRDFFYPVIQDSCQGFDPYTMIHSSDLDPTKIQVGFNTSAEFKIVSSRVRVARNLSAFPLNPGGTKGTRLAISATMEKVLGHLSGEFRGNFLLLASLSQEQRQRLIDEHFLFRGRDKMQAASGYHQFWPHGRGMYLNANKTFLTWVNEGDHLRVISMQKGADITAVFQRLVDGLHAIERNLKTIAGVEDVFMTHPSLGYVSCCPSNLGTGLRASVLIRLPKLSEGLGLKNIDTLARTYQCQARGSNGENSEIVDCIDISNFRRVGLPEWCLLEDIIMCVNALAQAEDNFS